MSSVISQTNEMSPKRVPGKFSDVSERDYGGAQPKLQTPSSKLQRSSKNQDPKRLWRRCLGRANPWMPTAKTSLPGLRGIWSLVFLWILDPGVWNFPPNHVGGCKFQTRTYTRSISLKSHARA